MRRVPAGTRRPVQWLWHAACDTRGDRKPLPGPPDAGPFPVGPPASPDHPRPTRRAPRRLAAGPPTPGPAGRPGSPGRSFFSTAAAASTPRRSPCPEHAPAQARPRPSPLANEMEAQGSYPDRLPYRKSPGGGGVLSRPTRKTPWPRPRERASGAPRRVKGTYLVCLNMRAARAAFARPCRQARVGAPECAWHACCALAHALCVQPR